MALRTGQAARFLSVHNNTLRRWSDQGLLQPYRLGSRGDRRFRLDDLERFLKSQGGDDRQTTQ
ncbi:MAG: helix-turn-helix domain-containing protein [Dehalococcoidales bacterium]|nr:helix-turn-helix domain-containing protein [Dehalococcoidales bacterium]